MGHAPYVGLRLAGTARLADALRHLYVLLPVLDDAKHYWVGEDEVTKLLRAGEGWLADHPERDLITDRYLAHRGSYVESALTRLADVDDVPVETDRRRGNGEPIPLAARRRAAVIECSGRGRAARRRHGMRAGCAVARTAR